MGRTPEGVVGLGGTPEGAVGPQSEQEIGGTSERAA